VFEEKHGMERSDPSLLLVKESDVYIDTRQRPTDASQQISQNFVDKNADLLVPRPKAQPKKKKPRVKKDTASRKTMFTYIESDEEEDKPKGDSSDSDSEEEVTHHLGTVKTLNLAQEPKKDSEHKDQSANEKEDMAVDDSEESDQDESEEVDQKSNQSQKQSPVLPNNSNSTASPKRRFLMFHGPQSRIVKRRIASYTPKPHLVIEESSSFSPIQPELTSQASPKESADATNTTPIANISTTSTASIPSISTASTTTTTSTPTTTTTSSTSISTTPASMGGWAIPDFGAQSLEERKKRKLGWAPGEVPGEPHATTAASHVNVPERKQYVIPEAPNGDAMDTSPLDGTSAETPATVKRTKNAAYYVLVNRTDEVERIRGELPIIMEEHQIIEQIKTNDVIIICGETGSGKVRLVL